MHRLVAITIFAALLGTRLCVSAQEPSTADGTWKLETVRLVDGKEYRGLLQSRSERAIDFAEIVQRPGKPTFAILRTLEPAMVAAVERLPPEARAALTERFRQLRHRSVIEGVRMEAVVLREEDRSGRRVLAYDGDWFSLASTADEEATRRCVVRIEQIFRAYRTFLPPRVKAPRRLEIELFATLDEYRQELKSRELDLDNPAIYGPREGRIVAASELALYSRRLAEVRKEAAEVERRYEELEKEFTRSLARLSGDLKGAGFRDDEVTAELNLRKASWKKEKGEALARMREQMRRNEARFGEVTDAMFRRLYHEALHAWLDTYVFPSGDYHVPRWLHEGLAQVFESGQLEGDALRLDAPDPRKLRQLQAELRSASPLSLSELLAAQEGPYAGRHAAQESSRHYLYSWGLAQHLVFRENLLTTPALEEYVSPQAPSVRPVERFQRLVGMPLGEWEAQWREAMLALPAAAR